MQICKAQKETQYDDIYIYILRIDEVKIRRVVLVEKYVDIAALSRKASPL